MNVSVRWNGKEAGETGVTEKTERSVLGEKWRRGVRLYSRQEVCCVIMLPGRLT